MIFSRSLLFFVFLFSSVDSLSCRQYLKAYLTETGQEISHPNLTTSEKIIDCGAEARGCGRLERIEESGLLIIERGMCLNSRSTIDCSKNKCGSLIGYIGEEKFKYKYCCCQEDLCQPDKPTKTMGEGEIRGEADYRANNGEVMLIIYLMILSINKSF